MSRLATKRRRYGLSAVLTVLLAAVGLTATLAFGGSAFASRVATTTTTTGTTTTTTTTTTTAAPKSSSQPTLSGTPEQGQTLNVSNGSWSGETITYSYSWKRCDTTGGSCSAISGATSGTYKLTSADVGNTLRATVTAKNSGGSNSATTVPTAVIKTAAPTTPAPSATGCPAGSGSVQAAQISSPARLQVASFSVSPDPVGGSTRTISVNVHITDTCGQPVQGALVDVQAVPFNQFNSPSEQGTDSGGNTQVTMQRQAGYPAARHQELLVLFIRARKTGDNVLAGISSRRLVSVTVNLSR
jgi:hypothetical protein